MQPDREFRPHGRLAHEGHKSKVGMSWDTEIEPVYSGINGDGDLTPRIILRQRQRMDAAANFDTCKGNPKCMVFSVKSCVCGGTIEFHADNKAICSNCQTVFNDGGNIEGCVITTQNYSDGRKVELLNRRQPREVVDEAHRGITKHFLKKVSC